MDISGLHHVAIISSDYERSKRFYIDVLGCTIKKEFYRQERGSWKLDLLIPGTTAQIELFSFPDPPQRMSGPEATGLRHLALRVTGIERMREHLAMHNVPYEDVRVDEFTGNRFFFARDPDDLPTEFVEA